MNPNKPMGGKAYGSIPHLPNSRLGPKDYSIHEGQARILTEKTRDQHDTVIVTEKLDGACVAIGRTWDGEVLALTRSGHPATSSRFEHHHHFAEWVRRDLDVYAQTLPDGMRIVGEYLGMAHGTLYDLAGRDPFFVFDIFEGDRRLTREERLEWLEWLGLAPVPELHFGPALAVSEALELLGPTGRIGTTDGPPEGVVYRVERDDKVDFLAKFVAHDKQDGRYFSEITGQPPVYLWTPS